MNKKLLLSLLTLLFILSAFSQKVIVNAYFTERPACVTGDTIYYSKDRPLTWKDFQGEPEKNHFGAAVTSSGFGFGAGIHSTRSVIQINIGIYTFFNKLSSWRRSFISSDYHLQHEQHHFDITRLGAEKFRMDLMKANFTKENYHQLLNEIFQRCQEDNVALQNAYDKDTEHSINQKKQLTWNDRIVAWVNKLP